MLCVSLFVRPWACYLNDLNDPNDLHDPNDWMTESFADDWRCMVYFINFISVQCTVQHKKGVIFAVNYIASLNTKNMHHTRVLILWFSINRELLYHNIIYHVIYLPIWERGALAPPPGVQNMQIHLNCRKRIKIIGKDSVNAAPTNKMR